MRTRVISVVLAVLFSRPAFPQEHPAQLGYEVVSIHLAAPNEGNSGFSDGPQGGMRARNVTAMQTLLFAYGIHEFQLIGVPNWARSERFYITFTPAEAETSIEGKKVAEVMDFFQRQRQRMQAVLRDRFQLVLHQETKEAPIYLLRTAKNGPKFKGTVHPENPQTGDTNNIKGGKQLVAKNTPMSALADALTTILDRPVRDETQLVDKYDFKIEWAPDLSPGSDPFAVPSTSVLPSMFTALIEQLGLRLESGRGSVPVFVVDKIEQPKIE